MRMRSTVFFMALASIASTAGQNWPGVELAGDWKTSLEVSGTTLRLILHMANGGSGMSATLDSLDQGALGLKVDSIRMEGPRLLLEMSQFGARYEGDWNAAANQFEGKWKQGAAVFPLNWKRAPHLAKGQGGIDGMGPRDATGLARLWDRQPYLQVLGCVSVLHPDGGALGSAYGADRRSFEFDETVGGWKALHLRQSKHVQVGSITG